MFVLSVGSQTSSTQVKLLPDLARAVWSGVWNFVHFVGIGIYFAVYWVSMAFGEGHYTVMEGARRWGCGNKFMECRGWD